MISSVFCSCYRILEKLMFFLIYYLATWVQIFPFYSVSRTGCLSFHAVAGQCYYG